MEIGNSAFSFSELRAAAGGEKVTLAPAARQRIERGRAVVEKLAGTGKAVYGINTGFGALAEVRIDDADLLLLQRRLLLSHAVGVGAPLSIEETRALMILRAVVLATGTAGVRPAVVDQLLALYNLGIVPVVPEKGSVGASGDLAPLAHLSLALIGEGEVFYEGQRMPSAQALSAVSLAPLELREKEGLALVNGTQAMCAVGGLAVAQALELSDAADIIGALSVEGLLGSHRPFDYRIARVRPHPGHARVAERMRALLTGGTLEPSHQSCRKVQDAYSLRCMPQVHGASRDALAHVEGVLRIEFGAATDNPLVFVEEGEVISGGNFHGQPIALALDYAAIAVAELANISERRIEQLVNPQLSGLPAFLSREPGKNSGFMMAQVTAASLVNENKVYCYPASVDSIPGSASREDHVSMGMTSARKLREVVSNTAHVLAIEWLCAAQAIDLRAPLVPGPLLQKVHGILRQDVPTLNDDRWLAPDLGAARRALPKLAMVL